MANKNLMDGKVYFSKNDEFGFTKLFPSICGIDLTLQKEKKVDLPERYIINENATILFWQNGEKTVVKRAKDDEYDPVKGFLWAFFQHYCGMSKNKANKYLAGLEVEQPKVKVNKYKELTIGDRVYHEEYGTGKIINDNCQEASHDVLVEFDKYDSDLHDGNDVGKIKGKDGHCWWCFTRELKREDK